jgi:hypothetical protein
VGLITSGSADTLPKPTGDVVLKVSGDLADDTSEGGVIFDIEMLRALPQVKFATKTQWTEGEVEFIGVSLRVLLDHVAATGETVSAVALNDYRIDIPADSLEADAPIVAYLMDGEEMSPRGKGPLWIVYPYDTDEKYRTETIYSRSIWQLNSLISTE